MTLSSLMCPRCRTACDQRSLVKTSCWIPVGLSRTFAEGLSCEEFRHVPQDKSHRNSCRNPTGTPTRIPQEILQESHSESFMSPTENPTGIPQIFLQQSHRNPTGLTQNPSVSQGDRILTENPTQIPTGILPPTNLHGNKLQNT